RRTCSAAVGVPLSEVLFCWLEACRPFSPGDAVMVHIYRSITSSLTSIPKCNALHSSVHVALSGQVQLGLPVNLATSRRTRSARLRLMARTIQPATTADRIDVGRSHRETQHSCDARHH